MGLPVLTYRGARDGVAVDLDRFVASRALYQANSGGGKSRAIRQLVEETHGRVQQFILDPEGEFATLRERFDYVLAAKRGGDVEASPRTARVLCRRLLEIGASAVLDLYELTAAERREFVKLFLVELMALPRNLWRPLLVVIDEAHLFAPERGSGEAQSTEAVIDLCTRGRKRGFCAVLATQRISKLHKDAAAELLNKFIGRTGLDVDVKRAGDELGLDKEGRQTLPRLEAGEFYVYGPAVSPVVQRARSGAVVTTHPEAGRVDAAAPPPPTKVKALLGQLADLPQQAAQEARTLAELQAQVKQLQGDLRRAQKDAPAPDPAAMAREIERAVDRARTQWTTDMKRIVRRSLDTMVRTVDVVHERAAATAAAVGDLKNAAAKLEQMLADASDPARETPRQVAQRAAATGSNYVPPLRSATREPAAGISNPQQRMLDALRSFELLGLDRVAKSHVAVFSNQSSRSSGFRNNLSVLSASGLVERVDSDTVRLTDDGRALASADAAPASLDELHSAWLAKLSGPQRLMLSILIAAHPAGVERDELAKQSGQSPLSSGYRNNLSVLSALGLTTKSGGEIVASDLLYPEGLR